MLETGEIVLGLLILITVGVSIYGYFFFKKAANGGFFQ